MLGIGVNLTRNTRFMNPLGIKETHGKRSMLASVALILLSILKSLILKKER